MGLDDPAPKKPPPPNPVLMAVKNNRLRTFAGGDIVDPITRECKRQAAQLEYGVEIDPKLMKVSFVNKVVNDAIARGDEPEKKNTGGVFKNFNPKEMRALKECYNRSLKRNQRDNWDQPIVFMRFFEVLQSAKSLNPFLGKVWSFLKGSVSNDVLDSLKTMTEILGYVLPNMPTDRIYDLVHKKDSQPVHQPVEQPPAQVPAEGEEPAADATPVKPKLKLSKFLTRTLVTGMAQTMFTSDITRDIHGTSTQQPITFEKRMELLSVFNDIRKFGRENKMLPSDDGTEDKITEDMFVWYFDDTLADNISVSHEMLRLVYRHVCFHREPCNFPSFCEMMLPHGYILCDYPKKTQNSDQLYNGFFADAPVMKESGVYLESFADHKNHDHDGHESSAPSRKAASTSSRRRGGKRLDNGTKILEFIQSTPALKQVWMKL